MTKQKLTVLEAASELGRETLVVLDARPIPGRSGGLQVSMGLNADTYGLNPHTTKRQLHAHVARELRRDMVRTLAAGEVWNPMTECVERFTPCDRHGCPL